MIPSWIEYLILSLVQIAILHYIAHLGRVQPQVIALSALVFAFAAVEKVKKEQFVVGATNSKTKKLMIQVINQMTNPVALVSKKGQLLFYNGTYENMVEQRLGVSTGVPMSVLKLVNEEEPSGVKFRQLIESATGPQAKIGVVSKAEVRLVKSTHKQRPSPILGMTLNSKIGGESQVSQDPLSQTKTVLDKNLQTQKDFFSSKQALLND